MTKSKFYELLYGIENRYYMLLAEILPDCEYDIAVQNKIFNLIKWSAEEKILTAREALIEMLDFDLLRMDVIDKQEHQKNGVK